MPDGNEDTSPTKKAKTDDSSSIAGLLDNLSDSPAVVTFELEDDSKSERSSSKSEDTDQKPSQPYSEDSQPMIIMTNTAAEILVTFDIAANKVKIILNKDQRPSTGLVGGRQGDHITNYQTLLQTICSVLDMEEPEKAPNILFQALKLFLDEEDLSNIKFIGKEGDQLSFEDKVKEVEADIYPRLERKQLTASLRQKAELIPDPEKQRKLDNIEKLKSSIKIGDQTKFASFVSELVKNTIKTYNKAFIVALPKVNVDSKDYYEGTRVNLAMMKLKLLNKLCGLLVTTSITDENKIEFIEDCKIIIKAAFFQMTKSDAFEVKFKETMEELFNQNDVDFTGIDKIKLDQLNCEAIGKLFNDLFDFKCDSIREAKPGEKNLSLVDNKEKMALEHPLNNLYKVTERHISFMYLAFPCLKNIENNKKDSIAISFYKKVITKELSNKKDDPTYHCQGWEAWKRSDPLTGSQKNLTVEDLKNGVDEIRKRRVTSFSYPSSPRPGGL